MSFTAGVFYNGETRMNHYTATLHMTTNSTDSACHSVAFERIKYFVYNQLDSTIFINRENTDQCQKLINAGLTVTTMPGEPVDQLIGLMLYYKLNAIMEDQIVVNETEISSLLGENMIYLHDNQENIELDFVPDWWTSSEPVHYDLSILHADKIVSMHANTAWREINLDWPEHDSMQQTGNVVVFADFNPANETK